MFDPDFDYEEFLIQFAGKHIDAAYDNNDITVRMRNTVVYTGRAEKRVLAIITTPVYDGLDHELFSVISHALFIGFIHSNGSSKLTTRTSMYLHGGTATISSTKDGIYDVKVYDASFKGGHFKGDVNFRAFTSDIRWVQVLLMHTCTPITAVTLPGYNRITDF